MIPDPTRPPQTRPTHNGRPEKSLNPRAHKTKRNKRKPQLPNKTELKHKLPTHPDIAKKFRHDNWDVLEQLRTSMLRHGIVEHGINPLDALQRAIDDTTIDYLTLRRYIDQRSDNPEEQQTHPLQDRVHYLREAMVRYSVFATQYRIQEAQQRISEARTALLATALKEVLTRLNLPPDTINQVPRLLIEQINQNQNYVNRLDENKAEALVEILHNDAHVEILEADDNI